MGTVPVSTRGQHERNFSKSLTNRKWTFSSESIRVQWIRWTPWERLSTPSSNMSGIFLRMHLVGLYTNRLPVFRWKARGYDWILVDSTGQPSKRNWTWATCNGLTMRLYFQFGEILPFVCGPQLCLLSLHHQLEPSRLKFSDHYQGILC